MTTRMSSWSGAMAYVWGYPMVNAHNRRAAFAEAPEPGLLGGVVPVAPVGYNQMLTNYIKPDQTFIVCPNQDVAYGAGFTALDKEPTVVPGAGLRRPLLRLRAVRPAHRRDRPDRQAVRHQARLLHDRRAATGRARFRRASTRWSGRPPISVFIVPRIFKDATPEDTAAVQPLIEPDPDVSAQRVRRADEDEGLQQVAAFPGADGSPGAKARAEWVKPETYFEELPVVMKEVPPLPGEEALYGWIASVWDGRGQEPGDQEGAGRIVRRRRQGTRRAALPVPVQRARHRQRLDRPGECLGVGHRLPEPHRHQQIEHVPEHVGGDAVPVPRDRQQRRSRSTATISTPSPSRKGKTRR